MTQFLPVWVSLSRGLPVLLLHVAATTGLWLAGWRAACLLIPRGNASESASPDHAHAVLSGAEALAFAVPLAACLASSINVADILLWGGVVVLLQLLFSAASRFGWRGLAGLIRQGRVDAAIHLALMRNGFALISAAAVSG